MSLLASWSRSIRSPPVISPSGRASSSFPRSQKIYIYIPIRVRKFRGGARGIYSGSSETERLLSWPRVIRARDLPRAALSLHFSSPRPSAATRALSAFPHFFPEETENRRKRARARERERERERKNAINNAWTPIEKKKRERIYIGREKLMSDENVYL